MNLKNLFYLYFETDRVDDYVAVKRVSRGSRQRIKEYASEVKDHWSTKA